MSMITSNRFVHTGPAAGVPRRLRFGATLRLVIAASLLGSPLAHAVATPSVDAAQSGSLKKVQPAGAAATSALPAPFLVAPGCTNGCRTRGPQNSLARDIRRALEDKAPSAPFLVAPNCGRNCLRHHTVATRSGGSELLAGGEPPVVVDSWPWPRLWG